MVNHCSVLGCREMGAHKFPKDPELRKQWESALRRDNFVATRFSRLCRNHFKSSDYTNTKTSGPNHTRKLLKKGAIPTVFPWTDAEILDGIEPEPHTYSMEHSTSPTSDLGNEREEDLPKIVHGTFPNRAGNRSKDKKVSNGPSNGPPAIKGQGLKIQMKPCSKLGCNQQGIYFLLLCGDHFKKTEFKMMSTFSGGFNINPIKKRNGPKSKASEQKDTKKEATPPSPAFTLPEPQTKIQLPQPPIKPVTVKSELIQPEDLLEIVMENEQQKNYHFHHTCVAGDSDDDQLCS